MKNVDQTPFAALSISIDQLKNPIIYLQAGNKIQPANIHLIIFAGINFCNLAPQYMPAKPPMPNKNPNAQSGAIAMFG